MRALILKPTTRTMTRAQWKAIDRIARIQGPVVIEQTKKNLGELLMYGVTTLPNGEIATIGPVGSWR